MLFRQRLAALLFPVFLTIALPHSACAQSGYEASLLDLKRVFSQQSANAIGEPFQGIHTSSGVLEGLFPVKSTGGSTAELVQAANNFLALLNDAQLSRTQFAIDDPEWRLWFNVDVGIFARQGVSLEEMSEAQKTAAWALLSEALSAAGIEKTRRIMRTEQALLDINNEPIRYGEEKYYFTVMGIPSADEPWGFQLDGHHLVINYFVLGDQIVMTPAFWGGEPVTTHSGRYAGNIIMQDEQDLGLALMQSLSSEQQAVATVERDKTGNDMIAAANQDNLLLDYQGLPAAQMTSAQRLALLDLIEVYVGNLRDPHAAVTMEEIGQHLDQTRFSWIGTATDDAIFYYRIHSPVILIEFDHQNPVGTLDRNAPGTPTRDHIHSLVRTPNGNDYGKDLLRQHLLAHPH